MYKNTKNINPLILDNKEYKYTLSYYETYTTNEFKSDDVIKYINNNYSNFDFKNCDEEIRQNLLNDLILFKTLKNEFEINIRNDDLSKDTMQFYVTAIGIFLAILSAGKITITTGTMLAMIGVVVLYVFLNQIMIRIRTSKKSDSWKLRAVNYAIHTLETIKEEIDKDSSICEATSYKLEIEHRKDNVSKKLCKKKEKEISKKSMS